MSYFSEVNVKNAADTVINPATEEKQDDSITSTDEISTRIGEVQASPTANTVLDRLKALLTGIVLAAGSAIIGKVGIVDSSGVDITSSDDSNGKTRLDTDSCIVGWQNTDRIRGSQPGMR